VGRKVLYTVAILALAFVLVSEALIGAAHLYLYMNPIPTNFRPAAPFTTTGWYFIYPPSGDRIDAPFSEWKRSSNEALVQSELDCEKNFRQPDLEKNSRDG
jgi:hypothetical protein